MTTRYPATMLRSLLATLLVLALTPAAFADAGRRAAPIEPMEPAAAEPAPEPVERPEREEAAEAQEPAAPMRYLTQCEQLRLDIHDAMRHYHHTKRDDRAAAYFAMRAGDPTARYLCQMTTCTPERQQRLARRLGHIHEQQLHLEDRLWEAGYLGASDTCHIAHGAMLEHLHRDHRHAHPMDHAKEVRHERRQRERQAQADEVDRRDPFELELEYRNKKARRTRGY